MAYTYHIAFTGTAYTEFIPSEEPKITYQEVAGEIFLRPVIEEIKIGALLNATVYAQLVTNFFDPSTFDSEMKILIKHNDTDAFPYRSSISNGKIDREKKIFMITPEIDDVCQDILNVYDKSIKDSEIIASATSIYYWKSPANKFTNVNLDTFNDMSNVVTWTFSGASAKYARLSWTGVAPIVGDKVLINLSAVTGVVTVRLVNTSYSATSNAILTDSNEMKTLTTTAIGSSYIEIMVLPGGDVAGTFTYAAYNHQSKIAGHTLSDYINAMLVKLSVSQSVRSTLLFGDALPSVSPASINSFLTASAGYDYVTCLPSIFNDTICIASLDYSNTEGLDISLQEIMNAIKIKLRCYWYIDSDGYMRIEHEKYFRSWDTQINLTSSLYDKYKLEVDCSLYTFDKSNIYSAIELGEPYATGADFLDTSVEYDITMTSPKRLSMSLSNIITDVTDVLSTTDNRSLFFLAGCNLIGAKNVVSFLPGIIDSSIYVQNLYMSWAYLLTKYWEYFGEAITATINGSTTLALLHCKEILQQVGLRFYYEGVLDCFSPVTLAIGRCWIKKIDLSLSSGFYTLDVGYDPISAGGKTTADSTTVTVDSTLITADEI